MKISKNKYLRSTILIFNIFSINIYCGHKNVHYHIHYMPKNTLVDICGQNCGQVDIIVDNCGHKNVHYHVHYVHYNVHNKLLWTYNILQFCPI